MRGVSLALGVVLLALQVPGNWGQVTVVFVDKDKTVSEGDHFDLRVEKIGTSVDIINVVVSVDNENRDFIGSSQVVTFVPGGENRLSVTFTVNDDDEPEIETTYFFLLSVINVEAASVGNPGVASVTVRANDDAYGLFTFLSPSPVRVIEKAAVDVVSINIGRQQGRFGQVRVTYKVERADSEDDPGLDIRPTTGSILFLAGDEDNLLQLQILPDSIPENNETFHVKLTNATQGARVLDEVFTVMILANDAPVRFKQKEFRFDEGPVIQRRLTVYRGLEADGVTPIGSVDNTAAVNYVFTSGSAFIGSDFQGINSLGRGSVAFAPGQTETTINVDIIDDNTPELEESFQVILSAPEDQVILAEPFRATVIINANDDPNGNLSFRSVDFLSPPRVQINEDSETTFTFTVIRTAGSFGDVSVGWRIFRNDSSQEDPSLDLSPTAGAVTFVAGQREKVITVSVVLDDIPEPSERFVIRLLADTVTSEAKVSGITYGVIVMEDSDNVYGVVQFSQDDGQHFIIVGSDRRLQLTVERAGLVNMGDVHVNMSVSYTQPGGSQDVLEDTQMAMVMFAGETEVTHHVHILPTAFLQVGGVFRAQLTAAFLVTQPAIGAYNTPSLGDRKAVDVYVSAIEANGEIGFQSSDPVVVGEPQTAPLDVSLTLTRAGTSGEAVISWTMQGTGPSRIDVTADDTGSMSGTVVMQSGSPEATIVITILPDDVPELEEELTVTLTSVQPATTQRLKLGATSQTVIIAENDNPGGIFGFSEAVDISYTLIEGGSPLVLTVERQGGALLEKSLRYSIAPNGEEEFFGATNVLVFPPGAMQTSFSILAKSDGVPELAERFTLSLESYGNSTATIGPRADVALIIAENDNPYGQVQFTESAITYMGESKEGQQEVATLQVERRWGTFGRVQVTWSVQPDDSVDLRPATGVITFEPNEVVSNITLESVPDDLTEQSETFIVTLSNPQFGAVLGAVYTKTLIIRENDYPLYFTESSFQVEEPSELSITLRRGGGVENPLVVKYRTEDVQARGSSGDFEAIAEGEVVFGVGDEVRTILVRVLDDSLAEGNESFYIKISGVVGDAVVSGPDEAAVMILANDLAYGIFRFAEPFHADNEEGSTSTFYITRDGTGMFGGVRVFCDIYNSFTNTKEARGGDFIEAQDLSVDFAVGESTKAIQIPSTPDRDPELDEMFYLALSRLEVLSGRTDVPLAEIADQNNKATIRILANDDPNGRYAFPLSSQEVSVAEDFSPGMESTTEVVLTVERRMGLYGSPLVVWEVYSDQVAGTMPDMYDLILLGDRAGVPLVPNMRRPHTGTLAVSFPENSEAFISVSRSNQPPQEEITDGFSIAAWIQPFTDTDGYIVAKTNSGGSRHFYTLALTITNTETQLSFGYSITGSNETEFQNVTLSKNIVDLSWHHIIVVWEMNAVSFYLDGTWQATRSLPRSQVILDSSGRLTVGAIYPGRKFFTGYMQDVRIYSRPLNELERRELYEVPAARDVTPVSGVLSFTPAKTSQQIVIRSIQDLEEESNEVFSVKLVAINGGGTISTADNVASLTVLKSDYANGQFAFSGRCQPSTSDTENVTVTCSVTRNHGDDGSVIVTWVVYQIINGQASIAMTDFQDFTGGVVFTPGQRAESFSVHVKDETLPEDDETFEIRLVNATSDDNVMGSTGTSGASIDPDGDRSVLVIRRNDNYNGILQFSAAGDPPGQNDPVIPPATERTVVRVEEAAGKVHLLVVRAQGWHGEVSAEWRTRDGTARSPRDYTADAGRLLLKDGERYGYIDITINDNDIPEDEKFFIVDLLNPSGGAETSPGSSVQVIINYSDGAFGIFQFDDFSLGVQAAETGDSGFSVTNLQVARTGGSIGRVDVTWQLLGDVNNDIVDSTGVVTFSNNQLSAPLELRVRGDTVPELDELFIVQLTEVSRGELGESRKLRAEVTVLANDDPYGVFIFPESQRPQIVPEDNRVVTMEIERLFGTEGQVEVNYTTLLPNETYSYIPSTVPRCDLQDYIMTSGSVILQPDEKTARFNVQILDDLEPEEDEAVFVRLSGVRLLVQAQIRPVDNSPRLGSDAETYGQIIISNNDNANGELQLSPISPTVMENATRPFLNVVRYGGAFGEVTVTFRVTDGSAKSLLDYIVLAPQVTLYRGEKEAALPIQIIDDNVPELAEVFTVQLDQVSGGGVLGTVTMATVTIAPSDDPNGAFGFSVSGQSVEEPEGQPLTVDITVFRLGGTMDIVTVEWVAFLNGERALSDITQASGVMYFLSNEASQQISITVLPDDVPEGQEDIEITLVRASRGRIGENSVYTLSILSNDNPHGVVQLISDRFSVREELSTTVQQLGLVRSGGSFGQLRVYYSTEMVTVTGSPSSPGSATNVLDYFSAPQTGGRGEQGEGIDILPEEDAKEGCGRACLERISCLSFELYEVNDTFSVCTLYKQIYPDAAIQTPFILYYVKDEGKAGELTGLQATPGEDYSVVTNGYVVLEAGVVSGSVPVSIIADMIPELDEKFLVKLVRVEVIGGSPSPLNSPYLGEVREAEVTILRNDDAYGAFRIYSNSPLATDDGHVITVEEKPELAVGLVVEREGGTIGEVSVMWSVDFDESTAVYGVDFIADGATLNFVPGETRKLISITILDDEVPEMRKAIVVRLSNNVGGARINNGRATIVILENDYVAGVLALSTTSVLGREGDVVDVNVTRTFPAMGTVTVDWYIQGSGNSDPALGFSTYQGSLEFKQGELLKTISLAVLEDDKPEANEEYELILANVRTTDVGPTGAAVLNQFFRSASVTIEGSNDPHGVVQFASNSQNVRMEESEAQVNIQVDRKFGAIGTIRIDYEITAGSVSPPSEELVFATPNSDFVSVLSYVDMGDGVSSAPIRLQILDDVLPELDEVFVVKLLDVYLITNHTGPVAMAPRLAPAATVAEVIISANDGTKGIAVFASDSADFSVDEISKNISLTVLRDKGTFGDVSVFFYAESLVPGTNLGLDYKIAPKELFFQNGESSKQIRIEIVNDDIPEPDETFQVILSSPKNGLILGNPSKANVTIVANDDASGFVFFDDDAVITLEEPGGDNLVSSSVEITVKRGPGKYGVVNVPFQVIPELAENTDELSPIQGIITFLNTQTSAQLTLTVLHDDIPEDAERFTLQLLPPDNSAKLGNKTQRTIIIAPNDSPNGLFSLYTADNRRYREISVEEGVGLLHFDVVRTQGLEGQVTVDIATKPDSAESSADVNSVSLAPVQVLDSSNVGGWYSYTVNDTVYLLMLKSDIVGELTSGEGSDGSDGDVQTNNLIKTTLFRWQGQLLPVQTVETDGARGATMFTIDTVPYLVIANEGNHNRYEAESRVYEIQEDGTLLVIQDLRTKGAVDALSFSQGQNHFLMIANSIDNAGQTQVDSDIYRWDVTTRKFSPMWSVMTLGISDLTLFELGTSMYLAVANNYDSVEKSFQIDSKIYRVEQDGQLSQHQSIPTRGAVAVKYVKIIDLDLLVFANNRDNTVSSPQKSDVYKWDQSRQTFMVHDRLETSRVESVEIFTAYDDTVYLVFANSIGSSVMYAWDVQENHFKLAWTGPPSLSIYPITVSQSAGQLDLVAVADKNITAPPVLYQVIKVKDSDFAPRTITMTFDPGQTLLRATVVVLQDTIPEDTELFYLTLRDVTGGAEIGPNNRIAINILSNDNAHGIIDFAPDSHEIRVQELDNRDNVIQINVIRHQGYFGLVAVRWVATGDHDGTNDITPLEGKVEFATGQAVATISLTIRNDDIAELQEVTYLQLTEVLQSGTELPGRGAQIGMNKTAKVVVLANDSPYGVVRWEQTSLTTEEPDGTDSTIVFFIVREQGMMGQLQVTYVTSTNENVPRGRQAVSGEDYVARQGMVIIQENVTRAPVEVVIKQDFIPEAAETFLVNITRVVLVGQQPLPGAEPSVQVPGNIIDITIAENDNARGIVQFNVTTNIEGRIDVYEEHGMNTTVALQVSRTVGFFGPVTVTWQADRQQATVSDFSPLSGTLSLADTQQSASIYITIIDDIIPEEIETFDVKLISVTGGALLGPFHTVKIAILKNDSPNGLFRFVKSEAVVHESLTETDPEGEVQLIVERVQGVDGVVRVQWRLNAEAVYDFMDPHSGTLLFSQGEQTKLLSLQTRPDEILEGEERFHVSLISADNNADISHTQGDATILILPDPGASGTISVLPEYRTVHIGEPDLSDPSYSGKTQVVLSRGHGIYGDISVTWSITPRNRSVFLQVEGTVNFVDLQQTGTITLQALDDNIPELRTVYTLQISSATGGALLSAEEGAISANIVFVASDHPFGVFVFDLAQPVVVQEDEPFVNVPVFRRSGLNGQVLLSYTTWPGTAVPPEDYFTVQGSLTFHYGQDVQMIEIRLNDDNVPEGLEFFYLNLTSARLQAPSNVDFSDHEGLQLDMPPSIGSLSVKEITILKNDNAEGTIQFEAAAAQFTVTEESGVARIPLERLGGNFGQVSVLYTTMNVTAVQGVDYLVPSGEVVLGDGVRRATINITVLDDSEMEFEEDFVVRLTGTTGGARLGERTMSVVTIAKSDYPNGKFGFTGNASIILPNPTAVKPQMFTVERTGGLRGQQRVFWRIYGPNNPGGVLEETNDIYFLADGQRVTQGSLLWEDGQGGELTFTLNIAPYRNWEIEKVFVVQLDRIQGFPASEGHGEISSTGGSVALTISKFGHPNGIVRFNGAALNQREVEEPGGSATRTLTFEVIRRQDTGVVGNIDVFWEIHAISPAVMDEPHDIQPTSGFIRLEDTKRFGIIEVEILPDDIPELTEGYHLDLVRVEGGGEIDNSTTHIKSYFRILFNDQPHGVFGIIPDYQSVIVDPKELTRHVQLNFTRHAGTFGSVILTFTIMYDVPQSGIVLSVSDGTVRFNATDTHKLAIVDIVGTGFLRIGTTFSVLLLQVQFLGIGVTDPPRFQEGQTEVKVPVPATAANSIVGFQAPLASVDEATSTASVTLTRDGVYGTLEVAWQGGFAPGDLPNQFEEGTVVPGSGSVTISHGVEEKDFTVQLNAKIGQAELFALHLATAPSTTVPGGARLNLDKTLVKIEPNGVVRFADNSTSPSVSEMFGKVYLQVIRLYGSEGKIEAGYRATGITAEADFDFVTIENDAVVMEPGQTSGLIVIEVTQDNQPEQQETFYVNLTDVEKFPTEVQPSISPRLSFLYGSSTVLIEESNDPYGVLSLEPQTITVDEIGFQQVVLTVSRTGGIFGTVSVLVRTVGGGESWTSLIVPKPGATTNNTIAEILGNRNRFTSATGGRDYDGLDELIEFQPGETSKTVNLTILSDSMAEPDETVLVFLTQVKGGARVAEGEPDGGRKGFSVITIAQNDLSNGMIGFSEDSKSVTVDEDRMPVFSLKLARTDAFFGQIEVSWLAKVSETSDEAADAILASQLERTAGSVICPAMQPDCFFNISLKDDQIPEEEHQFVVKLVSVYNDAKLNVESLFAEVTVLASDYVRGLIEFTEDTRVVIASNIDQSVRLKVNRIKGQTYRVEVGYRTMQMSIQDGTSVYGVVIYPALEGEDFDGQTGTLIFQPDRQLLEYIEINLTPFQASSNPWPKQFHVVLRNPTNGASLNENAKQATVIIVESKDVDIWTTITDTKDKDLTDEDISDIISKLDTLIQPDDDMTEDEVTLVETMINAVLDKGLETKLPNQNINRLMNIMCKMLTDKEDATRGRYSLAEIMEKLAYLMVAEAVCPSPSPPDLTSLQCSQAKISAGRWPLGNIQGFQYPAQRQDLFDVPDTIPGAPSTQESECLDFHFVEYTSEQWFMKDNEKQLLSNKIIGFGLKNRPSTYTDDPATFKIHSPDRRITTPKAKCVYFDKALKDWVGEVCQVTNDLDLGVDDHVDCSCKHLTHYGVKATTTDSGLVGYNIWFYVSCFICMSGLLLAILAHHVFSISAMFSASLLMHMCFACMATQICYVVAAYLSPSEIIVGTLDEDNYRCIVMGLFLHYFFLAQFIWMMTQAVNFWKILVLNDEHTDRKYVFFFLLGWGLPVVLLAIFYVVVFNLYKYVYAMPYDFIYGDINNNGNMCFITNPYAALGGVIVPVLLALLVVAVVCIKAFQVTPQWQAYDDIYRGRYNISEVRTILLFWAVIILTWLWGGLHLVYGHLWMLIVFCIFNIIQGLMALVLYALLRNPFLIQCFAPQKASSYAVNATILDPTHNHPPSQSAQYQINPLALEAASLKGSRASLLNESWERDSLPSGPSTMKVKRTLPSGGNIYVDPPVLRQGAESETKDFDDLLYALKTGGSFSPSDSNSLDSDRISDISSKVDKYELRRIDIADTHL